MPIRTAEEWLGYRVGGRYPLDRILSRGGMGVLFHGIDGETGRGVAVKMIAPAHSFDPDRRSRFLREVRIAGRIRHPNITEVLDVCEEAEGGPFLVMELLTGSTLAERLVAEPVLGYADTLALLKPIMSALAAAHDHGVVHRDVKPSNIFLSVKANEAPVPKLLDFGIARVNEAQFETQSGLVLGTPGYMAPEQCEVGECGAATDVWGMAAVFYRCLTGRVPHDAETVPQLIAKLVREPVVPLDAPEVPRAAAAVIDRALSREPHRRYATMRAFLEALERAGTASAEPDTMTLWREDTPHGNAAVIVAELPFVKPRADRRLVAAGLAVAAAIAGTLVFVGTQRHDEAPAKPVDAPRLAVTAAPVERGEPVAAAPLSVESAASDPKPADDGTKKRARQRAAFAAPSQAMGVPAASLEASVRSFAAEPDRAAKPAGAKGVEHEPSGLPVVTEW
jgi:serine/threonine protein kinase